MAIVKHRDAAEHLVFSENRQVLMSNVLKIAAVDPLSFFTAGLKDYAGERFYWSDPTGSHIVVGLGQAYKIEAGGDQRFDEVAHKWRTLLDVCIRSGDSTAAGTGPLLFGGFSFDPKAEKTALWHAFPDALFIMPTILLTVTAGECWLTVNRFVKKKTDDDGDTNHLNEQIEALLNDARSIKCEWDQNEGEGNTTSNTYTLTDLEVDSWKRAVEEVAQQIRSGVMDKVALAREIRVDLKQPIRLSHVLKRLCEEQTESYVFAIEQGSDCFLGASPERLVKREGNKLYSMCLAGSIGRGKTEEEDFRLGRTLLRHERFRIEHEIVVDMIREAMEAGCEQVDIPPEPTLFRARYIQHLYTPVVGYVRQGEGLLSMVEKLHPTPALGGYPQAKAMKKIREMESIDRGWYAAPVGWLDRNGDGEFIGAIRCGLVRDKQASLFVGNGIVGDSDAESEFEETKLKPRPMLSALGGKE